MTAPTPEHGYLLIKRGLYYRANAAGYTGVRDHAGRYSLAEAEAHQDSDSDVTMTHESVAPEFSQSCYEDVKVEHLRQQRDSQAAELTRLRAENARLREIAQDAVPILEAVLEEREEVIEEEDEVLRDLIDRLRAAIEPQAPPHLVYVSNGPAPANEPVLGEPIQFGYLGKKP